MASFTDVMREQLQTAYQQSGLRGCREVLQSSLNEWQHTAMNVAVTGRTNGGKSSLINVFIGRDQYHGGAAVGITETTKEIRSYTHPHNDQLVFTDLPGVGSLTFKRETYLKVIKVDKYDFFLLVTSDTFHEDDAWLATELNKRNKPFFFVRTHIDENVRNDKRDTGERHNENQVVAKIRAYMEGQLRQVGAEYDPASPPDVRVFLIANNQVSKYDYPRLFKQFIENFPVVKREALLLTMRTQTKAMVDMKVECLRQSIWKAAAISAAVATIPIPGTSFVADAAILLHEMRFYYEQLGLDDESLQHLATGVEVSRLKAVVRRAYNINVMTATVQDHSDLLCMFGITMALFKAESALEAGIAVAIPVIGQALAASMSYGTTYWMLRKILDQMHVVAKEVMDVALELRDA